MGHQTGYHGLDSMSDWDVVLSLMELDLDLLPYSLIVSSFLISSLQFKERQMGKGRKQTDNPISSAAS